MTNASSEALHAELRGAVGEGFPVPPNWERVPYKRQGYRGESMLNEYRVLPHFRGTYAEVMREAERLNAAFMPYPDDQKIAVRWYAHPISKEEK